VLAAIGQKKGIVRRETRSGSGRLELVSE